MRLFTRAGGKLYAAVRGKVESSLKELEGAAGSVYKGINDGEDVSPAINRGTIGLDLE